MLLLLKPILLVLLSVTELCGSPAQVPLHDGSYCNLLPAPGRVSPSLQAVWSRIRGSISHRLGGSGDTGMLAFINGQHFRAKSIFQSLWIFAAVVPPQSVSHTPMSVSLPSESHSLEEKGGVKREEEDPGRSSQKLIAK